MLVIESPTLVKNTGERSIYDRVSNFEVVYLTLVLPERASPARKAPVISATPKNSSAIHARARQKTNETIVCLRRSFRSWSRHLI